MGRETINIEKDKKIAKGLLCGNKRVLRKFYEEKYQKLLSYVGARVKNKEDAEEIVQDTFLGFLESLPLFSFKSSLWTFLVSIARHEIADYYRRMYAKRAIRCVPFVDRVYSRRLYSAEETAELFEQCLERIKPDERRIILWKYDEGLTIKEIARRLGVGVKAAESRLFRARGAFKMAYVRLEVEGGK